MRPFRTILLLLPVLISSNGLRAQSVSAPATPPSVVTIGFNAAVLQTAEAQREMTALQAKFAPRQVQIKTLNDELETQRKQLQATSDKLSDAERASRERSLSDKEKQLQRQVEDFKNDSQSESQQIFQSVAQKLYTYLQSYAQQHSYAVVIERGSDTAPVVWYSAANLDITADLVKAYDSQSATPYPASTSKPTPQSKPTSPKLH
jgi:outer membrane protein